MKTNSSLKLFRLSTLTLLGIAFAALLALQPRFAQAAVNELVITEFSDTSLMATYNGVPLTVDGGNDFWTFTMPNTVTFNNLGFNWIEPENPSQVNLVVFGFGNQPKGVLINSDISNTKFPLEPNGATVMDVGTDSSNSETIDATFQDISDVPEPAAWAVSCLITCLIAVHFLRGVCSKKTAKSQRLLAGDLV